MPAEFQLLSIIPIILLGILIGTGVNYLADVLPSGKLLDAPACDCGEKIGGKDYILWRRCRSCGMKRSVRSIVVQVIIPIVLVWMWIFPPHRLGFWVGSFLLFYFSVVAVIDIEYRVIQHPVSIFGAITGALTGLWLHGWWVTLIGGLTGFGLMLALYFFGEGFRRIMARIRKQEINEVALGFGDVNLNGVLGLIMGWPGIAAGLFLSVMVAGVFSIGLVLSNLIRRSYQPLQAIPYAPFLIMGSMYLLFFA